MYDAGEDDEISDFANEISQHESVEYNNDNSSDNSSDSSSDAQARSCESSISDSVSSLSDDEVGGKSESGLHSSVSCSSDDILFSKSSLLYLHASVFSISNGGDDDDTYEAATVAERIIAFRKSGLSSSSDDDDDDDDDDDYDEFEDEPSTNSRTTSVRYSSSDSDSDSSSDSDEYMNDHDEFEDEQSTNKRTVSFGNLPSDSNDNCYGSIPLSTSSKISSRKSFSFVSFYRSSNKEQSNDMMEGEHADSRKKLLVDRENIVYTRVGRFTRWIIAFSMLLVCIVIAILVTIYIIDPVEKPSNMSVPSASPNAVSSALYTIPLLIPAVPVPAFEPTPIPPNKVIAEITFLAYVPRGKGHWVTPKSLEEYLTATLEVLVPQILNEALERKDTDITRRLMSTQDSRIVAELVSVDVDEVTCLPDANILDLCVKNSFKMALIYTAENFTPEYIADLPRLYESLLINAIDDGSIREVDPSVILISYVIGEDTKQATEAHVINSKISTEPSIQPSVRGSSVPTMIPAPTLSPKPTFGPSPAPSSSDSPESVTTIPSLSPSFDTFEKPTESPSLAPELSSRTPSAMESIKLQTTSPMPSQSNVFEEDVTLIPTSSNTLSESEDVNSVLSPTPTLTTSVGTRATTCFDENNACQAISESGKCSITKCDFWEWEGKCSSNAPYMNQNCRKSCGLCGDETINLPPSTPPTASPTVPPAPCIDKKDGCAEWATLDQCALSPIWMRQYCKHTCSLCDAVAKM